MRARRRWLARLALMLLAASALTGGWRALSDGGRQTRWGDALSLSVTDRANGSPPGQTRPRLLAAGPSQRAEARAAGRAAPIRSRRQRGAQREALRKWEMHSLTGDRVHLSSLSACRRVREARHGGRKRIRPRAAAVGM